MRILQRDETDKHTIRCSRCNSLIEFYGYEEQHGFDFTRDYNETYNSIWCPVCKTKIQTHGKRYYTKDKRELEYDFRDKE